MKPPSSFNLWFIWTAHVKCQRIWTGWKFEKENSSNKSLTKAGAGGFCPAIKSCTGVVVGSPGQYRICSLNEYFVEWIIFFVKLNQLLIKWKKCVIRRKNYKIVKQRYVKGHTMWKNGIKVLARALIWVILNTFFQNEWKKRLFWIE